jgi:hypothetical protein
MNHEERAMMSLDLTQPEFVVLEQILANKIPALLHELAHTDDRSYREYLKETIDTVERLKAKVDASVTQDLHPPA